MSRAPRTIEEATHGAGLANTARWIARQVEKTARTHPEIEKRTVEAMAATACGYAVSPDYPENDRNKIFRGMLAWRKVQRQ